jgi:hypothetical protein
MADDYIVASAQNVSVSVRIRPLSSKETGEACFRPLEGHQGHIQLYGADSKPVAGGTYAYGKLSLRFMQIYFVK